MPFVKNYFYKIIFLLTLIYFFVSCGAFNDSKKPAGNHKNKAFDQLRLSGSATNLKINSETNSEFGPDNIKNDQASLKLQLDNKKLSKSSTPIVQDKTESQNPTDLYKKARQIFIKENYSNAATLFTEFVKNYPNDTLVDNAAYWLGECYYSAGDYNKAILIFKDLVRKYPKSEKTPDATLKTGYSYYSLYELNRAHHYLKLVITKYPFSPAAQSARSKIGDFE